MMTEELDMFDSRSVSSSEGEDDSPRPVVAAARRPFKVPIRIQNRESPVVLQHKKEEEEEETPPLTPKAKRPLFKSCHKKIRRIKFVAPNRHEKKLAEETIVSEEPAVPEEEEDDDDERVVVFAPKKRKKFKAASRKEGAAPAILRHQALELCPGTKVPPLICQFLRPHQRDGVQFLFDCVTGRRDYPESVEKGFGAILADGMGLGKTLQTIALLYTLLQSIQVRRIVVVCPCSLVGNWESEFEKWINSKTSNKSERLEVRGLDGSKAQTEVTIEQFLGASRPFHVLVSSYETLRANVERFARQKSNGCDLLVADEAQRLKGAKTQVNLAISRLASCKKRILLTGTPLQNDLEEFHAMADVANPGTLGSIERFRQRYVKPIVASREPDATPEQVKLGKKRQRKLAILSKCFVLRRENRLNAIHLPPKLDLVLCCAMPPAQQYAYEQTLNDKQLQHALQGKQKDCFSYIDKLLKVCNHPILLSGNVADDAATKSSCWSQQQKETLHTASGKMVVLYRLMREMRRRDDGERIVVVANATSSLDIVSKLCDREGWPWCLLDGKTPLKRRKQLNVEFNDPSSHHFAFLLSSTAGGAGLNLIGGNRLVLYDSSWNPATDKQAAARCWRDGNPRRCFTYRLISTGTIEEKMYQRQLSKEGLLGVIEDREQINTFSTVELKRLFMLDKFTTSDTHASLDCDCVAACSSNRQRDDDDSNKLGKKRTAACREYVVSESLKLVATKLPPQSSETKKRIVDHLETVRSRLSENHFLTMPLLCREIERIFVELVKSTKDEGVAAIVEKIRGDMQKSWHELVHKLYLIDEEEESCEEETKDISEEKKTGHKPQVGMPTEEDLKSWSHHSSVATVDDDVLKAAISGKYRKSVSFVFGLETTASLIKQAEEEKEKKDIHDQVKENVPPNKEDD